MDRDKLSKTIAGILKMLVKATQQDRIDFDEDLAHEQIMYLLAPVIEDAELWEKVEELARYKGDCGYCKNDDLCMKFPSSACYICEGVVQALKEDL